MSETEIERPVPELTLPEIAAWVDRFGEVPWNLLPLRVTTEKAARPMAVFAAAIQWNRELVVLLSRIVEEAEPSAHRANRERGDEPWDDCNWCNAISVINGAS